MVTTVFGNIDIFVNGNKVCYDAEELPITDGKTFTVDKRYKITVDAGASIDASVTGMNVVECVLDAIGDFKSGPDNGQYLELISVFKDNLKLCIGVESEYPNVTTDDYTYLKYGLRITTPDNLQGKSIVFGVAWLETRDVEDGIFAEFAADPRSAGF